MAVKYGSLPFEEAITFLRNKVSIPTERWTDVWRDQHDVGFMVAGATKADLINDLFQAVDKAASQGTTLETFRQDFDETVATYGWEYNGSRNWRTRVIYETNLRTAQQAGRHAQLTDPDVQARRPYWQYRHGGSADPRPEHLAWDGMVRPADDPIWDLISPPNDWGCSCKVMALSEADLESMGITVSKPLVLETYKHVNKATGEVTQVPVGVGPGWDYAPGRSVAARTRDHVAKKARRLPDALARRLMTSVSRAADRDPGPAPGDR
ncbi:hypothetical protein E4656_13720 [Natronospirillum operosum]|uniref:Phage head morphogenesis domain-containing protein n=1 Tax=Natronospirillum operosum TaxID=2759953 RepID=A0A4Z0W7F4_9GAMM|nr:phage minor head protein [Natronospirillum operosum]TGG92522.1 hypothetical protein E4656_13720 [Natronospirillum operosum]